jgi:uncharacterized protein YecE (DUF72 family)
VKIGSTFYRPHRAATFERWAASVPRAFRFSVKIPGGEPGGWRGLAYFRLHGSPRIYYSSYEDGYLDALAIKLRDLRRRRIPS